ncbi:pitrilysin family protein [Kiloniella laminariae]|uniref:Pitrilysin family protein n=1 Tax=Kiloniella laminariae TaxID=454162 RepID=A0ABT4LPA7_9PROT|nr:pitrilysin family protein [Kiloniella laminariae]MCZ4281787.1 pitrilysin family protein [Kiloniella laminariae]
MTIEISTLPSGLRVATDRLDSVESVSLGAWIGVGTRNEEAKVNGVAHLLEHMVFKGTEKRTAYDIAEEIEAVGGQLNAYTSRENTAFYAKVLKDDVPLALDTVADILQRPLFDASELKRERQVVLQELGQANDTPDDIIFDHFQETAYQNQALGRPVLGKSEIISRLSTKDLRNYMGSNYGSNSMVVCASGKVDHAEFVKLAEEQFGGLDSVAEQKLAPSIYSGGNYREERVLEQAHFLIGFEGADYLSPDYYAANVLATLFGGGMSSRLFQEIREKRGLVYTVYAFASSFMDSGLFGVYAGTGEKEAGELVPVVADMFGDLTSTISEEELVRARSQLKASILMGLESTGVRCEQLAQQLLIFNRSIPVEETVAMIEAVDVAAVQNFATKMLSSPVTLAALGPIGQLESQELLEKRFVA